MDYRPRIIGLMYKFFHKTKISMNDAFDFADVQALLLTGDEAYLLNNLRIIFDNKRKYVGLSVEYWHQSTGLFLFSYVWRDITKASLDNILIYKIKDDGKVSS